MKIAQVAPIVESVPPKKYGGTERVVSALTEELVRRSFMPDLFDPTAGIRTMSTLSPTFNPGADSYHNGSFWPVINGMAYEGLLNWGYLSEAKALKEASLLPLEYFDSPIELYIKDKNNAYQEYESNGHKGCRRQAWSAAAMLDFVTE